MFTPSSTPNQIRSMPSLSATGASSGTMMNASSKKSRKNASRKTRMFTTTRKPIAPPGRPVSRCSTQKSPFTARNVRLNTVEPTRMKMTKEVSFAVEFIACRSSDQLSRRLTSASTSAPGGAHRAAFGRRGDAEEDRAEHEEDQRERRNQHEHDARAAASTPRSVRASGGSAGAGAGREAWTGRTRIAEYIAVSDEAGQNRALVHVAHRAAELVGEHDQHQARRNDLRERARSGDHAAREAPVIAVAQHDRQRDQAHRDDRRCDDAGGRGEQRADQHHRIGEPAAHRPNSWPIVSSRSSAMPLRSRTSPMKVKNGMASSVSLRHDAEDALAGNAWNSSGLSRPS